MLFSPFSCDAASYDEGSSEGHGSLVRRTAGIWANEPCLLSDEPAALRRYTDVHAHTHTHIFKMFEVLGRMHC